MADPEAGKQGLFVRWLRATLGLSAAAGVFLAFAWPFAVSSDPDSPTFRLIAIATLVVLLTSLAALAADRAWRLRSGAGRGE